MNRLLFQKYEYLKKDIAFIADKIINSRNINIVNLYPDGLNILVRGIIDKNFLTEHLDDSQLHNHIFVMYDCSLGNELFLESMEAALSIHSNQNTPLKQIYDLINRKLQITLVLTNYEIQNEFITKYCLLFRDVNRDYFNIITFIKPNSYFAADLKRHRQLSLITHNLLLIGFLDKEESFEWIKTRLQKTEIKLSQKEMNRIYQYTGGSPNLIRNYTRLLEQNLTSKEVETSTIMLNQINIFWNNLSIKEQKALQAFRLQNNTTNYTHELDYLNELKILDLNSKFIGNWINHIDVPVLERKLQVKSKQIYFGKLNIASSLTDYEKDILKKLLLSSSNSINREEVANIRWKGMSNYSDWAIDQIVSRLRKKLRSFGVINYQIKSDRNKGYILKKGQ